MSTEQPPGDPELVVWEIRPTHPQGFGGHVFEYQPSDDLFKCINCGRYEIVVRDPDTGEIQPCPGEPTSDATAPSAEIEQRRRNVAVLELMDQSYRAHAAGDRDRSQELMQQATDLDLIAVSVITGGMTIGEVPKPGEDGWQEYLDANRTGLADAEAEAAAG